MIARQNIFQSYCFAPGKLASMPKFRVFWKCMQPCVVCGISLKIINGNLCYFWKLFVVDLKLGSSRGR